MEDGVMIQACEAGTPESGELPMSDDGFADSLGPGQTLERKIAQDIGIQIDLFYEKFTEGQEWGVPDAVREPFIPKNPEKQRSPHVRDEMAEVQRIESERLA